MSFDCKPKRPIKQSKDKISPLTNHRNTKKGAIKGGFDRVTLFENVEKGFDNLFGYQRDLQETFEYCNTMKNGNLKDKLRMQETEIFITDEEKQSVNVEIDTDISTSVQQQVTTSVSHSNCIDSTASLFSILPSDVDIKPNPQEEEFLLRKKRKKKKRRRTMG